MNTLIGRKCKLKVRSDGPMAMTGIIHAITIGQTRNVDAFSNCGLPNLIHTAMLVIELLDFDKGRIIELPIEYVKMED